MLVTLMRKVFVHCRLLPGGAAQVLEKLIQTSDYNSAVIITLFSSYRHFAGLNVITIIPRRVQSVFFWFQNHRIPLLSSLFDYRNLIIIYPQLVSRMRQVVLSQDPDCVVISSFAISKNIVPTTGREMPTTLYLHSPMQYIHTHYDEYVHKINGIKGWLFRRIVRKLTQRDTQPRIYDHLIANSNYTVDAAQKVYRLNIDQIQYPSIDRRLYDRTILSPHDYLVYVGRLVRFVKEVDRIIHAANATQTNLVLIGSGPDEEYLRSIAGPTCIFLGRNPPDMHQTIGRSRGLINITKESFGIATAEALVLGVPVLGYDDGATPELVDEYSGLLIPDKNHQTIIDALDRFGSRDRDRQRIATRAKELLEEG